jgi:hypothetical protein
VGDVGDVSPPQADLDALAVSLRTDERDAGVFFRVLCQKLVDVLPLSTEVERDHSIFKKRRLARRVTVRLGDETLEAELGPSGVTCRHIHSVQGVGGGLPWSKQVSVDEWLRSLVATVAEEAQTNADAASALRMLVT